VKWPHAFQSLEHHQGQGSLPNVGLVGHRDPPIGKP
jgi:hypothetical protein